ncbi:hypothetical protein [Actinokineospora globicatena]|uniref:hypothetical protein n=1 Tax=Actinokineospora globicatena TaxID=103729 RepID=UPI0020A3CF24|nr:hypothetical protein [Actinokineospora globicatena]GLW82309.1 hypothetical protein Aglo01_67900 [Actinokineospora globicatena]GLW89098.1 hypothetical protein Aglo02_67370 [Actinokineospora globicatena]
MRCNDAMRALLADVDLAGVSEADLPAGWMRTAAGLGWTVEADGAVVATALRATYSGLRSGFSDLVGYEGAVNGRSVVDYDLPEGADRLNLLVRRSWAYVTGMLAAARGVGAVVGFVGVGTSATEQPFWEAHVTFWVERVGVEGYFGLSSGEAGLVLGVGDVA